MNFDYTLVEQKLELKDFDALKVYLENNETGILKELERLNQVITHIQKIIIFKDYKSHSKGVYGTVGFTLGNNGKVVVELLK